MMFNGGKGVVVHDLPPDPETLIASLAHHGADWIAFKVHDGDAVWGESRHVTKDYVRALRGGFAGYVAGWGYVYCDGLSGDDGRDADGIPLAARGGGLPEGEANAALDRISELGLDGYVADFERQCEGHADLVERFSATFDGSGRTVARGAFVWASLRGHEGYPTNAILDWLGSHGYLLPMVYQPDWSAESVADWRERWPVSRTIPTVSLYAPSLAPVNDDLSVFRERGYPGFAVWSLDALLYAGLSPRGVQERSDWLSMLSWPSPAVDPERWRAPIFALAGDAVNAGYFEGHLYQQIVRWCKGEISKTELRRSIDGAR
jgi:hypothetical protein